LLGVFLNSTVTLLEFIEWWTTTARNWTPCMHSAGNHNKRNHNALAHRPHKHTLYGESILLRYFPIDNLLESIQPYLSLTFINIRTSVFILTYIQPQYYPVLLHSPFYISTTLDILFILYIFTIF
jgi:hypothetical protein